MSEDKTKLYEDIIDTMDRDEVSLKNGRPFKRRSRTEYSVNDLRDIWEDEDYVPTAKDFKAAIELWKTLQQQASTSATESYPIDIKEIIQEYMQQNGFSIDENGIMVRNVNGNITDSSFSDLKDRLYVHLHQENNRRKALATSTETNIPTIDGKKELIDSALTVMLADDMLGRTMALREKVKYVPNSEFPLEDWLDRICDLYGLIRHPQEDKLMFKQMLWTMKRHLFCKPVIHRFMFVFYSPKQGIGKSLMCKELNDLWPHLYSSSGSLKNLKEGKEKKAMFNGKISCDFSELAGYSDDELGEVLKDSITNPLMSGRDLYSNTSTGAYNRVCMLSSSNLSVSDVLRDSTGMRRFYEFEFEPTVRFPCNERGKLFAAETLVEVFQCINEGDDTGFYSLDSDFEYAPLIKSIQAIQDTYSRREDRISMFLRNDGTEMYSGNEDETSAILALGYSVLKLETMKKKFDRWMEKNNYKVWNMTSFKNALKSRHYTINSQVTAKGGEEDVLFVRNKSVTV